MVTFPAWVLFSFMYCLLVVFETSFTCYLMTTCVTGIFRILVQIVMMNLKHTLSSGLILTLVTGKHVFSITDGEELREESRVIKKYNNNNLCHRAEAKDNY